MPQGTEPDRLLVAVRDGRAIVRVRGRGSFKVSAALKEFAVSALEGEAHDVVVDLGSCVGMDSTFMGVLAGLARRCRQAGTGGRVVLLGLSVKTRGLVSTLGLDRVVEGHLAGETPPEWDLPVPEQTLAPLEEGPADRQRRAETMLEAHETLVSVSDANAPRFRDVLDYLREEVRGSGGAAGGGEE